MQVRVEEQDDEDRDGISLMGRQSGDGVGQYGAMSSSTSASTHFGNMMATNSGSEQHTLIQDAKTLPQMIS